VAPFTGAPSQDGLYTQEVLKHGPEICCSLIAVLSLHPEGQNKAVRQMAMSAVELAYMHQALQDTVKQHIGRFCVRL
jgi:hypothetical protein